MPRILVFSFISIGCNFLYIVKHFMYPRDPKETVNHRSIASFTLLTFVLQGEFFHGLIVFQTINIHRNDLKTT